MDRIKAISQTQATTLLEVMWARETIFHLEKDKQEFMYIYIHGHFKLGKVKQNRPTK